MISHFTIKLAPAANQKEIMKKLSAGETLTPHDLANLSKCRAKLEIVGDYQDLEKVRDVLKELTGNNLIARLSFSAFFSPTTL